MSDWLDDFYEGDEDNEESLGRIPLDPDGYIEVEIFRDLDAPNVEEINYDLRELYGELGIDPQDPDFQFDQIVIGGVPEDFDYNDKDVRGGYDRDEAINFLDETGFWHIADIYYDEDTDTYYIDINYDDGQTA
jgi:hypothetical protein